MKLDAGTVVLLLLSLKDDCSFENAQWRKVKQMQPMKLDCCCAVLLPVVIVYLYFCLLHMYIVYSCIHMFMYIVYSILTFSEWRGWDWWDLYIGAPNSSVHFWWQSHWWY